MFIELIVGIIFTSLALANLVVYYKRPQSEKRIWKMYTILILIYGVYLVLSNLNYIWILKCALVYPT